MRRTIAALIVLFATGTVAFGQCPTPWGGWNHCTFVPAPGGGTYVLGFDTGRWRYWSTDIDPRGNMYGYDSRGNYWTYRQGTGIVEYYDSDRGRYGSGY